MSGEAIGGGRREEDGRELVVRRLREIIRAEEYRPGERLGSERELARALGVTRTILREALADLERDREIVRRIGRAGGVIVSDGRLERNINTVESLPVIARRQGFVLSSTVLSAVLTSASKSDVRLLELPEDGRAVYAVSRLREIDDGPLSLEITHLPAAMFPMFLTKDLTAPFYALFEEDYGIRPGLVDETLEPVVCDDAEADLLRIPPGTPLMRIHRIARDASSGRPFEKATDVYVASRMRFTMHHFGYVRLSATAGARIEDQEDHDEARR